MELVPSDWSAVFEPDTALFELIARGTILYLAIVALMRILPRRTAGELATMDIILLVLIADAASHALGDYTTIADAIVVIGTIVAWDYLLNVFSFHVPLVEQLVSAPPIQVVRDGELLRRNMRREFLTEEELLSHLRNHGFEDLGEVKAAFIEGEGKITAIGRR